MPRCFVIQPFDKGPFDNRFDDVFAPAIEKAGLEPYRVDRDPSVAIPIETIEENIRSSDCCLADISIDNPNVWYEVGFAFATGRDVVLVCSEDRTKFPFDVSHRKIITYTTHSPRDFNKLSESVVNRLKSVMTKAATIKDMPLLKPQDGLAPHELTALVLLMGERITPDVVTHPYSITQDIQKAGFSKVAASLALESLRSKGFVELSLTMNEDHGEEYMAYKMTEAGVQWCLANQRLFVMEKSSPSSRRPDTSKGGSDDDIPF